VNEQDAIIKYRVILADPPWQYSNRGVNGAAEKHYSTLNLTQLKLLPVERWADDSSVLALWCTNPMLPEGLQVIEAWGFQYVTKLPWIKFTGDPRFDADGNIIEGDLAWGTGWWARGVSEDILIAKRGNIRPPQEVTRGLLGLMSRRLRHSQKPSTIYDFLEKGWAGPYLELFARERRPGWDVWGNEVESTIDLFAGLPSTYIQDRVLAVGLEKIRQYWDDNQMSYWRIGDTLADIIRTTRMKRVEVFRLAVQQMRRVETAQWPKMMYYVSRMYKGAERSKESWSYYRTQYERIISEAAMHRREKRRKIQDAKRYVDAHFFPLDRRGESETGGEAEEARS